MTCHDARDQFSALVDDVLAPGERAALDAHLATCADCRRELQRFRDTVALVRAVAPVRAPAGFVDRVREAARPAPWYRRLVRGLFLPWPVKLPMEAAAIVLVGIGVALVYRATPDVQQAAYVDTYAPAVRQGPESAPPRAPAPARETSIVGELRNTRDLDKAKDHVPPKAPAETSPPLTAQRSAMPSRAAEPQKSPERREMLESQPAEKLDAPPATAERERALARRESLQSHSATAAPGSRADTSGAKRSAPAVAGSLAFVPPAVSGRLAVTDRDVALRGVAELATRLGAVETHRADIADGQILELTVPREAYPEFIRELARLGRWEPSKEPAELPAQVRVVLQITR